MLFYTLIWLAVGGVVGGLASIIVKTDPELSIFSYIVVATAGAAIASVVISPLVGLPAINSGQFSIQSVLVLVGGGGDPACIREFDSSVNSGSSPKNARSTPLPSRGAGRWQTPN